MNNTRNRRIAAARLLKQCPELAPKIQDGKITLSQLPLAQSALKQEEKKLGSKISKEAKGETLKLLENKTHFESQKMLVNNFPDFKIPKQTVIPTKNKTVKVELEFSEGDWSSIQELSIEAHNLCEYVSPLTGQRCQSHKFLDIDHKIPLARNGGNEKENLRIFCRAHNHLLAEQTGLISINNAISLAENCKSSNFDLQLIHQPLSL